jgi:hypothetical protein
LKYRKQLTLPKGFEATDTHKRALQGVIEKSYGLGWEIVSIDMDRRVALLTKEASMEESDNKGTIVETSIQPGTTPEELQDWVKSKRGSSFYVVKYDRHSLRATYRELSTLEEQCIRNLGPALKMKPWEMQIKTGKDGAIHIVLPPGYDAEKLDETLQRLVTTSIGSHGWIFLSSPHESKAVIKPGKPPTFSKVIKPSANGGEAWHSLFVGEALGTLADPSPKPLYTRFDSSPHTLVSGMTGGGKSVFISNVICQALLTGWDVAIVEPCKSGVDFWSLRPWIEETRFAYTFDAADRLAGEIVGLMNNRIGQIRDAGKRKWTEVKHITPILMVVDELSTLLTKVSIPSGLDSDDPLLIEAKELQAQRARIQLNIQKLLQTARSAGIFVLLATQTANQATGVPPIIRNLCGTRALMGISPTTEMRSSSLANADAAPEVPTWLDSSVSTGVGIFESDGSKPVVFRSVYLDDNDLPSLLANVKRVGVDG